VRRIEAVTGEEALHHIQDNQMLLEELSRAVKAEKNLLPERIEQLLKREKELHKEIEKLKMESASSDIETIMAAGKSDKGLSLYTALLPEGDMKVIMETAQRIKDRASRKSVIVLAGTEGEKVNGVVMVTDDIKGKVKAGEIASGLAALLEGGGGGRPDMARFGGKQNDRLNEILEKAAEFIR
jgi:alanyl-tRNA synthetase